MGRHSKPIFRQAAICHCGQHGFVGLSGSGVALFDPVDQPLVSRATWSELAVKGGPYARALMDGAPVLMHRVVYGLTGRDHGVVDHINHDPLDNRRANLRRCTQAQNKKNRSTRKARDLPKGVYACRSGRYFSSICVDRVRVYLGSFDSVESAEKAYRAAAVKFHGEYAARARKI